MTIMNRVKIVFWFEFSIIPMFLAGVTNILLVKLDEFRLKITTKNIATINVTI